MIKFTKLLGHGLLALFALLDGAMLWSALTPPALRMSQYRISLSGIWLTGAIIVVGILACGSVRKHLGKAVVAWLILCASAFVPLRLLVDVVECCF